MVIVAAVDRSDRASNVIKEAESLAQAYNDAIHVLHVLPRSEFVNMGVSQARKDDPIDMKQVRETAAKFASEAATSLESPYEIVGLMGTPSNQIVEYASDQDARYIVVAGRKRSPAGKAMFGSVAQSVLLNARCPVVSTFVK
ncbi:universal stress protein [Natrialbaceae archaeon A-CW1-1]